MFVRSAAVADVENGGWPTSAASDALDTSLLPREHRLLETVHSWVAGFLPWVAILLFLFGFIPFSFLVVALLCVLCLLACLRTLALSVLLHRLQQGGLGVGEGSTGASGEGLLLLGSGNNSLLGGLLNLRLSMLDRDFSSADYDLLLGLDRPAAPRRPASEAQLAALPTYQFRGCKTDKAGDLENPTCSVCLEKYQEGTPLTALPCAHSFHRTCITKWLRQQGLDATCPICKSRVFRLPEGPV